MLQAAARVGFDFRGADPRDPAWRHRLTMALYCLERESRAEVQALHVRRCAGLLGNPDLTAASFKDLQEQLAERIERVQALWFPWVGHDPEGRRRRALTDLSAAWAAAWGDPDDPATRARIDATAQWLESRDRGRTGK